MTARAACASKTGVRGRGETGRRCRLKIGFLRSAGSSPAVRTTLLCPLAVIAACGQRADTGPVVVSAIGQPPTLDLKRGGTPSRLLVDATAQGLVRFDAAGHIEPGLAERWIVLDDGASYIFRLREAYWADGRRVTAREVVRLIGRRFTARDNPLAPFFTAIDRAVVMTPQVIEVRLRRPRPDLLKLLAQPEMALRRDDVGAGPMRIVETGAAPLLRPAPDPSRTDPDDGRGPQPEDDVRLIGERAALAILRFDRGRSDLVSGGGFAEWPLLATADVPRGAARIDPAAGLFGLAVVRREGFLADAENRAAVSQVIDRAALTAAVLPQWTPANRLLPEALDSAAEPRTPTWVPLTLEERRAAARARVAAWTEGPVRLRIALPAGPGATLVWGQLAASLAAIGIGAERVAIDAPADLRLVDAVAPYDSARWYMATACRPCSEEADTAIEAARDASTLDERARRIAEADAALDADVAFIPLARPLRWSLVSDRLTAWQPNARAWHPLNRLRAATN